MLLRHMAKKKKIDQGVTKDKEFTHVKFKQAS